MIAALVSLANFLLVIGLLIAVHEYGHFIAARKCGVKVLRFSIGFGSPLLRWYDRHGTEFVIAWVPLGGYVRMLDERDGQVDAQELMQTLNHQSISRRNFIALAGPLANIIFAVLSLWCLALLGIKSYVPYVTGVASDSIAQQAGVMAHDEILAVNNVPTATWAEVVQQLATSLNNTHQVNLSLRNEKQRMSRELRLSFPDGAVDVAHDNILDDLGIMTAVDYLPIVIGMVIPGMPADLARLRVGDEIVEINGKPMHKWIEFVDFVQANPNRGFHLTVSRDNQLINTEITPNLKYNEDGAEVGIIGVMLDKSQLPMEMIRTQYIGPLAAFERALGQTVNISLTTTQMIGRFIIGQADLSNLGGPITLSKGVDQSIQGGLEYFLSFLSLISISLAIINLMPVPV